VVLCAVGLCVRDAMLADTGESGMISMQWSIIMEGDSTKDISPASDTASNIVSERACFNNAVACACACVRRCLLISGLSLVCCFCVCAPPACWLLFNDARVNVVPPEKVLESQAYLLFYARRPAPQAS
jgi:hypothetical protein